jgi:hypothetical protein
MGAKGKYIVIYGYSDVTIITVPHILITNILIINYNPNPGAADEDF